VTKPSDPNTPKAWLGGALFQERAGSLSRLFQGIAWTVLCCYMVIQILASFGTPLTSYDDAVPLVAADLILHGRKAAIDFLSFYPPLYYYLILAGFHFLGRSALVPTFFAAAIYVMFFVAVARFFWESFPHLRAPAPLIIFPTVIAIGLFTYPVWPGYAVSFLSLLAYISSRNRPSPDARWIALAGLLAGLSTLIRFNFGPYVMFAACADILVHELISETSIPATVRLKRSLVQVVILVIPFVLINVIFYASIYRMNAVAAPLQMVKYSMGVMGGRAFKQLAPNLITLIGLGFPCLWMAGRNVLYIGKLRSAALIAGVGAMLISVGLLAGRMPSISLWFPALGFVSIVVLHRFVHRLTRPGLCLLFFYVGLQHYFLTRADRDHAFVLYPVVAFSFILLLEAPTIEERRVYFRKGLIFAVFLALVLFEMASRDAFHPKVSLAGATLRAVRLGVLNPRMPDRQRLLLIDSCLSDEVQSTEFVRQRTSPSDPIFISVNDHSIPFVNHVRAYWLAERLPGLRYVHLDSAVVRDESVQQEIIAELQHNGVNWVILYNLSRGDYNAWFTNLPPAPKSLDNFLATQFREEARFGQFSVIRRR
jgi:hypothetical protein